MKGYLHFIYDEHEELIKSIFKPNNMKTYRVLEATANAKSGDILYWNEEYKIYMNKLSSFSKEYVELHTDKFKELKNPILTTEDNIQLYLNDDVWVHNPNDKYNPINKIKILDRFRIVSGNKYFSNKKSAEKWLENYKKEQLLKEAKEKYPIGTKFNNHNLGYECSYIITHNNFIWDKYETRININIDDDKQGAFGTYTVYKNGKWAEIIKDELPKSWREYVNSKPDCDNRNDYEYSLDLLQSLLILRDVYRQGWKPDWNDLYKAKYVIRYVGHDIEKNDSCRVEYLFSFQSEKIRDKFYENFKNQLEQLKELY